ncbi:alpha/beta fold hydrolase [Siculibacillus lacustris]|uniref:Alpha/beta fold hydrolase n=1 Tax=Siculibacillus lacustris TaxID=1549641 RepID=A0A4Q9VS42_9HYPH|nr:alpha/beta fold hydrolase [Siculibacillus lacustris]TBW38762.1 alpha/beta fold hydrolase [Siculibacillus lacustris]
MIRSALFASAASLFLPLPAALRRFRPATVPAAAQPAPAGTRRLPRPVALGDAAAWFHPAAGRRGVVIAGAFGYEDLCARPALTGFADACAAAGLPALRFDWRDTGDSLDLPPEADRVAAWIDDVGRAVDWMRRVVGVREVVLVGFRLGALIAAAATRREAPVERLVLLAPPNGGRAHARELTILARLTGAPIDPTLAPGDVDIAGFRLSAATLAGLRAIDLEALDHCPAADVLVVGEADSPATARLVERLAATGAHVDCEPFEGYARMMCDPTASEPPLATLRRVVDRLVRPGLPMPVAAPRRAPLAPPVLHGDGWTEEALVFADGLIGILCRPADGGSPDHAAIWMNSGRNHHIGWARQTVDQSRRLAAAGVAVLRFDFAGIGDSPARPATPRTALYHGDGRTDVFAALDEMERRGYRRITLIGACSGAHQAFHAAADPDPRIAGLVLVNTLCFVWAAAYAVHLSAWMTARPHEFEAEVRAASGPEDAPPLGALARLLAPARSLARPILAGLRRVLLGRSDGLVERRFRDFARRGLAVSVVLSDGDRAVEEFEHHCGPGGERVADLSGLEIVRIADADHSLTTVAARTALGDHLLARLAPSADADRRLTPPGADPRRRA